MKSATYRFHAHHLPATVGDCLGIRQGTPHWMAIPLNFQTSTAFRRIIADVGGVPDHRLSEVTSDGLQCRDRGTRFHHYSIRMVAKIVDACLYPGRLLN